MNWTADFPILAADENGNRLVYLDSAATTQHPMLVDYYTKENANPHRGVYELAMRATDAHEGARHTVAQFFNAEDDEIVFTQNTTESLNLVAYSYGLTHVKAGDEVLVSIMEHHSDLLPW
ncbi:MAG TPA: aminotransferase class V-fold PLP-dependent enzyme, partial [Gemmiger formicilis]|nr:aminotransferase class V-fold PLP-dependent enzyme [Gemmiger formicilis]